MPTQVQFRRGTTAQNNSFTGAAGELSVNTSNNTIRVHDGSTTGGFELAKVSDINTAVANLIDSAPGTLDTLNELAAAINDDSNFAATIVTQLGNKANTASLTTANVSEVTNLYFTNARVFSAVTGNLALKANVIDLTTANVSEVTNLYFTVARANTAIDNRVTKNFIDNLNVDADTLDGNDSLYFAPIASPNFTGAPLSTTATAGTNTTQIATTAFVRTEVTNLIASAPATLDTLNEIAAALGNDNNFSATIITQLGNKANTASLTTANVIELNSLYFTEARARQAISSSGCTLSYSNTTGIISFSQGNTDTVAEGSTNLYYTNARVFSAVTGNLALKANLTDKLNVFAATSSAELAGIISDETGTGSLVFNASPTFTGTINAAEISASGNVTSPFFYSQSDINLKKDIEPIVNALDIVKQLSGYSFKWKHNDAASIGLIAQYIEQVLPMLIGTTPDGSKTVLYNGIIALLLEAIKAQQIQIDEIKAKLDEKL